MASTFKSSVLQNVGTSVQTIYTGPASTKTTVIGLSVCNVSGSSVTVDVTFVKGGTTTVYLAKSVAVPVGGSLVVIGGDQKLVVEATDLVRVISSAASSIDVVCSYLEIA